jgi:4-amino-4-deoxy-L-arabinose transferase-like glycosyltransferase
MRGLDRREAAALVALTAAGAALRFGTLDAKGFWGDEISTVFLVHRPYGDMLGQVARLESTPPLYYSLAWLWAKLFGTTEVGLRSLSALLGTATIPLAHGAARELVSRRAALFATALVAVSPVLVWYSGEARSYALLVLLAAAALWCFGRALRTSSAAALALWAVTSTLAILAHYFAIFLAAPLAFVLIRRRAGGRRAWAAVAGVAAASAATLPLALEQASYGHANWIANSSFAGRLAALPGDLTLGFDAWSRVLLVVLSAIAIAVGARLAWTRASGPDRAGAAIAGGAVLAALALPLGLAVGGVAAVPLAIVLGAGFAAPGRVGRASMAALVAVSLAVVASGAGEPKFNSEDWRSAALDLGGSAAPRAIVATPGQAGRKPLEYYLGAARLAGGRRALVAEVDVIAMPQQGYSRIAAADLSRLLRLRLPGFRRVRVHLEPPFALLAYRAPRPEPISEAMMQARVKRSATTVVADPQSYARSAAARASARGD